MKRDFSAKKRQLLELITLSTATHPLTSIGKTFASFASNPFELGVASGSPKQDSVVLWTRLFNQDPKDSHLFQTTQWVRWEIAQDQYFKKIIQSGLTQAIPELGHSIHVEPKQLPANSQFFYRFTVNQHTSRIGQTKTLAQAQDTLHQLTLGIVSCQHYEHGFFSAYQQLIKDQPDVILFLGDYIYEYPKGKAENRSRQFNNDWLLNLADYRNRYTQYKLDEDLQAMHAFCPWICTWDDHEVQNDYAGIYPGKAGPEVDNFLQRRTAAYQVYYENMPIRSTALIAGIEGLQSGSELRMYDNFSFGNLANLLVLDARQYKSKQACLANHEHGSKVINPNDCPDLYIKDRSMLGAQQEYWLNQQLHTQRNFSWNIIGQQTLFMPRVFPRKDHDLIWTDGWDGYPQARQRLIDSLIKNQVKNLIFFGGDVHENYVGYIKENFNQSNSQTIGVEFCGTSLTSRDHGAKNLLARLQRNKHIIFGEVYQKGYGLATFKPHEMIVSLKISEDVTKRNSPVSTMARFKVRNNALIIEKID